MYNSCFSCNAIIMLLYVHILNREFPSINRRFHCLYKIKYPKPRSIYYDKSTQKDTWSIFFIEGYTFEWKSK